MAKLPDLCSVGTPFGLEWQSDISAVPASIKARLKSSEMRRESRVLFKNHSLDLRIERDRIQWFLLMLKDTPARTTVDCAPITTGFIDVRADLLCFEYVIQQRIFGRILQEIANDPSPSWRQDNLRIICYHLMHHRLVLRHIFQKTELWKPLLSAQVKVLSFKSIQRLDDPLLSCLMASMKHWERKNLTFAIDKLFPVVYMKYTDICKQGFLPCGPTKKHGVMYHACGHLFTLFGYLLAKLDGCSFDDFSGQNFIGQTLSAKKFIGKRMRFERMRERECGWLPCAFFNAQKRKRKDMKPALTCKGCKLIRYCCRNHQKKHWKFIHRQQCIKIIN